MRRSPEVRRPIRRRASFFHSARPFFFLFFLHTSTFQLLDKPWSQVSSLSSPRVLPSIFVAHRFQQSHCSLIFHRVLLTHALALSASQFVHKKKSPRIYTSMHSGGFELTKLTNTGLEDNLIRHRGDLIRRWPEACRPVRSQRVSCSRTVVDMFLLLVRSSCSRCSRYVMLCSYSKCCYCSFLRILLHSSDRRCLFSFGLSYYLYFDVYIINIIVASSVDSTHIELLTRCGVSQHDPYSVALTQWMFLRCVLHTTGL